ncbi:probable cysteine--tRNA ligase, mitochondrial [Onthophagus taurus]|uniref:probable cysteine--tRNA ligase, mitochondrial n=1 Tax=Onthophagus taurus TaxID=166361 RepID=UPI000C1FFEB2|nr:probable cysteine--tRNA ligase, mitochondrial [Onthophagus taurus]
MLNTLNRVYKCTIRLKSTWKQPEGIETGIKIYNCITKDKVPLIISKNKPYLTWYTCGPTVYDSAHIGHASCYIKIDIIQRILRDYFKFRLITVMNITDIDDKIINESKTLNRSPIEIARHYEKEYLEDLDLLKIQKPDIVVRVTDNMPVIVKFIKKLVEDKYAYKAKDESYYFDVETFKEYGKLQNIERGENSIVEKSDIKKNPMDFALWKAAKAGEPFWDNSLGPGRPGWHIECSALAGNILGDTIDIHAGGIDLRFPHHENEETQSCAYFNKDQWVNYWFHVGHLHSRGSEKMSKSLKNTISIRDMLKKSTAASFRMACLMTHYRNHMEFSDELLQTATRNLVTIKNFIANCTIYLKGNVNAVIDNNLLLKTLETTMINVENGLKDDFNTPIVLKSINNLMSTTNKMLGANNTNGDPTNFLSHSVCIVAVMNYLKDLFRSFGIDVLEETGTESIEYNEVIDLLIKFRQDVRRLGLAENNQNTLQMCDDVREELRKIGIYVKDYGKISSWSR